MSKVKVLVINPERRLVVQHEWNENLQQLYKWVGAETLDYAQQRLPNGNIAACAVDDVGLHKRGLRAWYWPEFYSGVLLGNGVMFGGDVEGETIDCPYSLQEAQQQIEWNVMWDMKQQRFVVISDR